MWKHCFLNLTGHLFTSNTITCLVQTGMHVHQNKLVMPIAGGRTDSGESAAVVVAAAAATHERSEH